MRVLCTFRTKAKYTEWWERTSARLWLAMVKSAREYALPMNMQMLRMVRATLLYDTLVLRLDRTIDRYEEYARFRRKHGARWAGRRWRRRARDLRRHVFLHAEELMETGDDLMARAQQTISSPVLKYRSVLEKWVVTFSVLSRTAGHLVLITGVGVALAAMGSYLRAEPTTIVRAVGATLGSGVYQGLVALLVILDVRTIAFRLREREPKGATR
jgi:hypothetical protein